MGIKCFPLKLSIKSVAKLDDRNLRPSATRAYAEITVRFSFPRVPSPPNTCSVFGVYFSVGI